MLQLWYARLPSKRHALKRQVSVEMVRPLATSTLHGLRYFISSGPEASRTVLLLHGLGNSLDYWTGVAPLLEGRMRVVAIDIPGFGDSAAPQPFTLEAVVQGIYRLLDGIDVSAVDIVGHSLGGLVAVSMAESRPDRVRRLVLFDATLATAVQVLQRPRFALTHPGVAANLVAQFVGGLVPLGESGSRLIAESRLLRYLALWPFVAEPGSLDADLIKVALRKNGGLGPLRALRLSAKIDLDGALTALDKPVDLYNGEFDRLIAEGDAEHFMAKLKNASYSTVGHVGHWPLLESPAATGQRILEAVTG